MRRTTQEEDMIETPWETRERKREPDYLAPDGSEIYLLPNVRGGGLAYCRLPRQATSHAVRHQTVDEVWYVVSGDGELWRQRDGVDDVTALHSGVAVTI